MGMYDRKVDVLVVGGGMISQDVILPTVFQGKTHRAAIFPATACTNSRTP